MRNCLLIILFIPCFTMAQVKKGIKFETLANWNQVLKRAKSENKFIFVDCYATWCGPCKYMDKEVYHNDSVGYFINAKFISVKVQMDTSKMDNDATKEWYTTARRLQGEYKVNAYPTFLFFSPN